MKEINNKTREEIGEDIKQKAKGQPINVLITMQLASIIDLLVDLRDIWKDK